MTAASDTGLKPMMSGHFHTPEKWQNSSIKLEILTVHSFTQQQSKADTPVSLQVLINNNLINRLSKSFKP